MQERRGIPKRGILHSDLRWEDDDGMHKDGANKVSACYYTDLDGRTKKGYFKAIDGKYTEFLAKISVLASVYCRMMLGEKAAEERLVFDKNGKIIGTVSRKVDGLTFASTAPDEKIVDAEQQIPSTETLLKEFVMEELLAMYVYANDDGHPHNLGLRKVFDYDMWLIAVSRVEKESRPIKNWIFYQISPQLAPASRVDFGNFPDIQDTYCTHWPTYDVPANLNPNKRYPKPAAFRALATNPKIIVDGKEISAQRQLALATLKLLLTRQPERLDRLLRDYFGDNVKLSYKDLSEAKQKKLEQVAPMLFSDKTNDEPFRVFGRTYHNFIYDCFYRTAVYYEGVAENSQGVRVPAFSELLNTYPDLLDDVVQYMNEQNQMMEEAESNQSYRKPAPLPETFLSGVTSLQSRKLPPAVEATPVFDGLKFNTKQVERDYLRIYRNSFSLEMYALWKKVHGQINALILEVGSKYPEFMVVTEVDSLHVDLVKSIDIFGEVEYKTLEFVEKHLQCDDKHINKKAINNMITLHKKWREIYCKYYIKEDDVTVQDSINFDLELMELDGFNKTNIWQLVGPNVPWMQTWHQSMTELQNLRIRMCYLSHRDKIPVTYEKLPLQKIADYREPEIVRNLTAALFKWLKKLPSNALDVYMNPAKQQYQKTWAALWSSSRTNKVEETLRTTTALSCDKRVADILLVRHHEAGAMNENIIYQLIKGMLESEDYRATGEFKEVWDAIQNQQKPFDIALYTREAVKHCRENYEVTPRDVNKYFLNWIIKTFDNDRTTFKKLVDSAHSDYERRNGFFGSFSTNRDLQIDYQKPMPEVIRAIFSEGKWAESSFNPRLYNSLLSILLKMGQNTYQAAEFKTLSKLPGQYLSLKPFYDDMRVLMTSSQNTPLALPTSASGFSMQLSPASGY